jgi:eukaryotic-like serine/threonine-protein kinase
MTLPPGFRLGAYEVLEPLGEGGMGEVFRARDLRLGREVAIKVLSERFTLDAQRRERFEREARVLASLSHPNIATLHTIEQLGDTHALVLELVDGETLAERIARGPMALPEALAIAEQIASALDAAHEHGVVHRDLKPSNVKLRADGNVKLLDFGLAKTFAPDSDSARRDPKEATATMLGAAQGLVMGTPAYMSPEQARGLRVDKRADVWAFGCLLYEMLAGERAFAGDHLSDVVARIIEREPDFGVLPTDTPVAIRRLLQRCLAKDPRHRLRDIGDARLEIAEVRASAGVESLEPAAALAARGTARWRERTAWSIVVLGVGIAAVLAFTRSAPEPPIVRFELTTPPTSDAFSFALSPDGQRLVFVATADGESRLWLRPLDQVSAQPLDGTEGASYPFWSPDSSAVGFFADGKVKRKDLTGGTPRVLADAPGARGGTWNRDGDIVFAPAPTVGLKRVAATGGAAVTVTELAPDHGSHRWPQFLPDGRRFLFFVGLGQASARGTYVGSLDGGTPTRLLAGETAAVFAPPGYLLRVLKGVLVAHRFDAESGTVVAESFPLAQPVGTDDGAFHSAFSVSSTGVLVHRPGGGTARQLVWVDAAGTTLGTLGPIDDGAPAAPELAPDGRRLALTRSPEGTGDVWLIDVARNVVSRTTFDPGVDVYPVWSPDGDRLIFSSGRNGRMDLFEKATSGIAEERPLLATGADTAPQDWSRDGRALLYTQQDPRTGSDLWVVPLDDARGAAANPGFSPGQPVPIAQSAFDEGQGKFSPDGRWIAYVTNETGRQEVYIQPFPDLSSKWQVSSGGGIYPVWRRDGRELYYLAPDMRLMAVPIQVTAQPLAIEPGVPRALFTTRLATTGPYVFTAGVFAKAQYAVTPEGQFLMNVAGDAAAPPLTLVLNWTAALEN